MCTIRVAPGRHAAGQRDRLVDREVRGVLPRPQGVADERLHALKQRPRLVGDAVGVGAVGTIADAEAEHRPGALSALVYGYR